MWCNFLLSIWHRFLDFQDKDNTYESFLSERFGDDKEEYKKEPTDERRKRSPGKYDLTYSDFIKTHFTPYDEYIPDKDEYKELKNKKDEQESVEKTENSYEKPDDNDSSKSEEVSAKLSDYDKIKYESDKQVTKQDPTNCKKTYKKNLACTVCKDPVTGDNSETCSYSSKPNDKKVAFSKQKSFSFKTPKTKNVEGNEDGDYEEETNGDDEEKPVQKPPPKKSPIKRNNNAKKLKSKSKLKSKAKSKPHHRTEGDDADYGAYKLASQYDVDYDEQPRSAKLQVADKSIEKNSNENLNTEFEFIEPYNFDGLEINRALSEFKKKDWSKCSKKSKGDLTCYYCKDAKGFDQEECIYVSNNDKKKFPSESPLGKIQMKKFASASPLGKMQIFPKSTTPPKTYPTVYKLGTIIVPERKTVTVLPVVSPYRPRQNYQALPITTTSSVRPEYTTRHITDNPNHKKKAIKRMITIKKQYYDSVSPTTQIYPNIMYYKQNSKNN